jgi:hypothetical protein
MGWSTPRPSLFTAENDPVPIVQEAGWTAGPVWTGEENLAPPGFDPRTVQPAVNHYTDYAILAHIFRKFTSLFCKVGETNLNWYRPDIMTELRIVKPGLNPSSGRGFSLLLHVQTIRGNNNTS